MRKKWRYSLSTIVIAAMLLTGCNSAQDSQKDTTATEIAETADTADTAATSAMTSQVVVDTEFTAGDLEVGYEESTACQVSFDGSEIEVSKEGATAKDGVLTISDEGTYVITGTLNEGQIIVDAEDTDKVQIVLNGVAITCSNNAPIYIKNADKIFVTLIENTVNTLIDGTEYTQNDDNNVDGVIYSKADLTVNGTGTLNITGNYQHGITSKDDLVITGGIINITAVKDALNGKDCVKIKDGTLTLSATTGNGIQSKNGDDATKGYVYISGGEITISKSQEGIEGTAIVVADGIINVTAEDDGFNAASGKSETTETSSESSTTQATTSVTSTTETPTTVPPTTEAADSTSSATTETEQKGPRDFGGGGGGGAFEVDTNCYISITGGTITVDASGDGLDSNGSLYVSGGTTYVSGPTMSGNGSLDYNGTADITGGTVVVAGSTGMAQGFSESSTQYSLLYNLTTACEAGAEVKLTDQQGNVVATYTPNKQYQSVVISTPELAKDQTYTLTCGDQTAEITLSAVVTSNGQTGMSGQGGRGGKPGMQKPAEDNSTGTESTESNTGV